MPGRDPADSIKTSIGEYACVPNKASKDRIGHTRHRSQDRRRRDTNVTNAKLCRHESCLTGRAAGDRIVPKLAHSCDILSRIGHQKAPAGARARGDSWFLFRSRLGCLAGLFVLAAEALDASGCIDQLLFAGKERVAVGANLQVDIALVGRSGSKTIPAGTHHADLVVCGMDVGFHFSFLFVSPGHTEPLREFSGNT